MADVKLNTNTASKDSEKVEQKPTPKPIVEGVVDNNEEDISKAYLDKRSIIISLVHNYSNYRKANMKVLGQRKEIIGSCIRSSQVLSSNADEVAAYFPALIGLSPSNPDFITRVKAWLNNIQIIISENEITLDTSFWYNTKKDYLEIKKKEDAINAEFDKVDRSNLKAIKEALKHKIDRLNILESSKYQYGHPVNIEQYLMYRHCLLYREVAKDTALINGDASIRFFIKDEAKEEERRKIMTQQRTIAMRNYVELNADDKKFDSVYVAICVIRNDNLGMALLKDKSEKQEIVMNFVNSNPDKFNKLVGDKHIKMKAFINTLIVKGELIKSDYNQQISTPDGTFVGANLTEAVAWFENPANAAVKEALENKLKLN